MSESSRAVVDRRSMLKQAGAVVGGGVGGAALSVGAAAEAGPTPAMLRPSAQALRYIELDKLQEEQCKSWNHLPDDHPVHVAGQAEFSRMWDEKSAIAAAVYAAPLSLQNVIDRAAMAWSEFTDNIDGIWFELQESPTDRERVGAEVILGLAMLAGLTDGKVEREGRAAERWWEQPEFWFKVHFGGDGLEPDLQNGDQVLIRRGITPKVGDIVLTGRQRYRASVLMRVTGIDDGQYRLERKLGRYYHQIETDFLTLDEIAGVAVKRTRELA